MPKEKVPAFQFYPKDFLADSKVAMMSNTEVGIYIRLICYCWLDESLPLETEALARMARMPLKQFTKLWENSIVKTCFHVGEDGRLRQGRLDSEREKQADFRRRASDGGHAKARSERMAAARLKGTHTDEEWREMAAAYGRCLRCGDKGRLEPDHIIPIYQGGSDSITNIQPLCPRCNTSKGADTTDHRIGQPETVARWLPSGCLTPAKSCSPISDLRSAIPDLQTPSLPKAREKSEDDLGDRARELLENYPVWYAQERHGARLPLLGGNLQWQEAMTLCRTWDDARLEKLARIVLTANDEFINRTDRGWKIFTLKASWADDRLRQWEQANGVAV